MLMWLMLGAVALAEVEKLVGLIGLQEGGVVVVEAGKTEAGQVIVAGKRKVQGTSPVVLLALGDKRLQLHELLVVVGWRECPIMTTYQELCKPRMDSRKSLICDALFLTQCSALEMLAHAKASF